MPRVPQAMTPAVQPVQSGMSGPDDIGGQVGPDRARPSDEQRAAAGQVLFSEQGDTGLMGSSLPTPGQADEQARSALGAAGGAADASAQQTATLLERYPRQAGQGRQGSVHHLVQLLNLMGHSKAHDQLPAEEQAALASLMQALRLNGSQLDQVRSAPGAHA